MEERFKPLELIRIVEDDAPDRLTIRTLWADHLRAEPFGKRSPDLGIAAQEPVHDLVTRPRRGAMTPERCERSALAGADSAGNRDREWRLRVSARRRRARRERLIRRPPPGRSRCRQRRTRARRRLRPPAVHRAPASARRARAPAAPRRSR